MDYYRIDDSHFISLITWLPKVVVYEIVEYTYNKCIDCNYFLLQKFECKCGITRCIFHAWLYVSTHYCNSCYDKQLTITNKISDIVIKCTVTICDNNAWCGYKNSVYYCELHSKNKRGIIRYWFCENITCDCVTNMVQELTNKYTCKLHQIPHVTYEYAYVKN